MPIRTVVVIEDDPAQRLGMAELLEDVGLTVVGFHGAMAADETPAKLGPVYVNQAGCLTRIVEVGPTQATPIHKIRVESFAPRAQEIGQFAAARIVHGILRQAFPVLG